MFLNFSESNRLTFESFTFLISICFLSCSLVAQLVKSLPVMQEIICNAGDLGLIPGSGRSSGGGHGNPPQYSCLVNPHGQRSLAGYSPQGHQRVRYDWVAKHACTHMVDSQRGIYFMCTAQRFSYTYTIVHSLFQIFFPYRLLQNIERSSLCYIVDPYFLSVLYIAACIC